MDEVPAAYPCWGKGKDTGLVGGEDTGLVGFLWFCGCSVPTLTHLNGLDDGGALCSAGPDMRVLGPGAPWSSALASQGFPRCCKALEDRAVAEPARSPNLGVGRPGLNSGRGGGEAQRAWLGSRVQSLRPGHC